MDEQPKRWVKGLAIMHARKRSDRIEKAPGVRGRPRVTSGGRQMVHEALHAALMGFAKA